MQRADGATGGHFSICYTASHPSGAAGFLKALNFNAIPPGAELLVDQHNRFTSAFIFERDLLAECANRRLTRIVRILDSGEAIVPDAGPLFSRVPYLILEPADGDVRAFVAQLSTLDIAFVFRVMKHTLQGLEQLHASMATHQDLKPSNVLTQRDGREMKIGDLGCADRMGVDGPRSNRAIPGAATYAPPEQQYGEFGKTWEERRASDMYLAGSLGTQLILGHCMSALLQQQLPPAFRLGAWRGFYRDLLPYLRRAHAEVIELLRAKVKDEALDDAMTDLYVDSIQRMTAPDPAERGHPRDRAALTSSYELRRFVSAMNLLMSRAEAKLKGTVGG
ncbi:MAG: hypothetical protein SFU57_10410 [Gemmatimonadales bacterium]|nr:hypothetical protein [Gemmatimonadales bacterium]